MKEIMSRIREILESHVDMEQDTIERLVVHAYYMGREDKAVETGNRVSKVFREQKERTKNCRYYKMAMDIQGDIDYVYDPDYAGDWTASFEGSQTRY